LSQRLLINWLKTPQARPRSRARARTSTKRGGHHLLDPIVLGQAIGVEADRLIRQGLQARAQGRAPLRTGTMSEKAGRPSPRDTITLQPTPLGCPQLSPVQALDGHCDRSQNSRGALNKQVQDDGKGKRRLGRYGRRL
jgi:hypothetical protein